MKVLEVEDFKKTIVMVTHDPQMASYCSRIILFVSSSFSLY